MMAQDQGNGSYVVDYLPEAAGAYSVSVRLALTAEAVASYGRGGCAGAARAQGLLFPRPRSASQ